MVSGDDLYNVMCAMVPLYFAMLVAYGSVKWCKMFTPEQCSGINRFVAVFAVPVLSFHFISLNNPYQMDTKFIIADTVSKLFVLLLLSIWAIFFTKGSLDWLITIFSLATLPNTLVMGIPLLQAMYGDFTQSLMVQLVVLQCIIWYTLLLFLLEYRAATLLIKSEFPGNTAASITKIEVDGDVISPRRPRPPESTSSFNNGITPRPSNLSNADIFSINTPLQLLEGGGDLPFGYPAVASPRLSGYASSDAYSLQPTPRASNFNEMETMANGTPVWGRSPVAGGRTCRQNSPALSGRGLCGSRRGNARKKRDKDARTLPCQVFGVRFVPDRRQQLSLSYPQAFIARVIIYKEISFRDNIKVPMSGEAADPKDTVAGLLWSLISFKWNMEMPSLIKSSIKIISDAGLGMAMFSLGLFMALQPRIIACGTKRAAMGMAIRFLCGPLVMSASSIAIGLRHDKLHFAIVQAALPQGIVPFVFAREYGLHPDILSTGVIFGMLISLPITLLYYIFLGL
ncbi:Membrane transport protein [Sesbania bispinosa]|nr:Membrane transport protein [Sesbania bispinosa]